MDSPVSDINKLVILQIAQIYQVPATKSTFLFQFSSKKAVWTVACLQLHLPLRYALDITPGTLNLNVTSSGELQQNGQVESVPLNSSAFHHPLRTKGFHYQGVLHVPYV